MNELKLEKELTKQLGERLRGSVVLRHKDYLTVGIPDMSVTWRSKTTWLEIKYAKPMIEGREIQNLTARRLARAGCCYYVIYVDHKGVTLVPSLKQIMIVHPDSIKKTDVFSEVVNTIKGLRAPGFDHQLVVDFIRNDASFLKTERVSLGYQLRGEHL